jgi:hypothetical protein
VVPRITSSRLARFYEIWSAARRPTEIIPQKSAIDVVQLGRAGILPIVWLVEREQPNAWRYRISGETINEIHGRSLAGKMIAELADPDRIQEIAERWGRVVDEPAMLHTFGEIYGKIAIYTGERIVLPLIDVEAGRSFILGATDGRLDYDFANQRPNVGHRNHFSDWVSLAASEQ